MLSMDVEAPDQVWSWHIPGGIGILLLLQQQCVSRAGFLCNGNVHCCCFRFHCIKEFSAYLAEKGNCDFF